MLCDAHPREVAALDGTTDIEDDLIRRDRGQRICIATTPLLQLSHRIRRTELSNRHDPHASTLRDLCDSFRRKQQSSETFPRERLACASLVRGSSERTVEPVREDSSFAEMQGSDAARLLIVQRERSGSPL
jgi:hypothetical protein